jgi:glycosyltransferase involved in cell wall biosynthesis
VVDDGSIDDIRRLMEEFHDSRIHTVKTDHHGPSAARNLGQLSGINDDAVT